MSENLSATIMRLRADDEAEVTKAARSLGLLLERSRFRRRGTGTLGDVDVILGDLASAELSESDEEDARNGLRAHLSERGVRANPTVVWAIGKAFDQTAIDLVADVAERAMKTPELHDLVYQGLVTIDAVAPGTRKELFLRASREAVGEAAEFATQQVAIRGWS